LVPKWLPKWVPRWLQIDPTTAILANKRHRLSLPELSKNFCFQSGSKMARHGQERPKVAVLQSLGPPKTWKNQWFFRVFVNASFRYFEALGGPLGLILAPLGSIWSQEGSQNRSSNGSQWPTRRTGSACRSSLKSSCFQDGSKLAPGWLKLAPFPFPFEWPCTKLTETSTTT